MAFDFDSCPERSGTDSTKWHKYADKDIIPCWIADMDFKAPPAVMAPTNASGMRQMLLPPSCALTTPTLIMASR